MLSILELIEDTRAYYSVEYKEMILEELFNNSYRTIMSVYIFKHFEEYGYQLKGSQQDKNEIYWNAAYFEKLTDYIKISIAFENYNKAVLLENGYLVHKIGKPKEMKKIQNDGIPIKIEDFKSRNDFIRKSKFDKYYLSGLIEDFPTINFRTTLNQAHQNIIQLDTILLQRLIEINELRNRLHFFTDFKGAYKVDSHLKKWKLIKELAVSTIEKKIKNKC